MMNCKTAKNYLSAYVDGELCGGEMLRVRRHLNDCRECAADVEELKAVKRLLGTQPEVDVPLGFEERLVSFVLNSNESRRQEAPVWRLALMSSMAAAAGVFMLLQLFAHRESSAQATLAAKEDSKVAFDVNQDMIFATGGDQFAGQAPVYPVSNVAGR